MPRRKNFIVKSSKQKEAWSYMCRNRVFRFGDLLSVLDTNKEAMHSFFWSLEKIGYLICVKRPTQKKADFIYRVLKHTGIHSPSVSKAKVYDHNIKQLFTIPKIDTFEEIKKVVCEMNEEIFIWEDIQEKLPFMLKTKITNNLREMRKKKIVIVDSVGKRGKLFFRVAIKFKGGKNNYNS